LVYVNKTSQDETKARRKQMADVLPSREAAIAAPKWAVASRKYAVEAIGTFFLVFTVVASVLTGSPFTPLAAGGVLMVMIYAGSHISGGHYNPAVTIAALWRRRIGLGDAVGYWIVQLVAGLVAGAVASAIVRVPARTSLHPGGHSLVAAGLVELLFTFALCYVMLNVATSKDQPRNSFFGLAIGFTVAAGAFAVGSISGGAFNPAVTFGGAVGGLFSWTTFWVYLVAQILAGSAAGLVFLALNPDDA
jgi:aquaporin Z